MTLLLWTLAILCGACRRDEARVESRPRRSSVLVVVVDALRADRLGVYGAKRRTSPAIDRLATESVLFENATTCAPRTWQSLASILTGLYPFHHGVRFIYDRPLAPRHDTLGTVLGRAGYETAAFGFVGFLREVSNGQGFGHYSDPGSSDDFVSDTALARRLVRWIAALDDQPFLAVVHFRGPHWPYTPKLEHHDALYSGSAASHQRIDHSFNDGGYGLARSADGGFQLLDADAYRRRTFEVDPRAEVREHMALHYDAAILDIDEILGSLLERLRGSGVLDRTLLVLTSDHGESLGEHGYLQHGPRVDEPVLHVPLLVRFPATSGHVQRGSRIAQLVRTVDILPTILDVLGLQAPGPLDGQSLLPAVEDGAQLQLTAYAESGREFMGVDPELVLPGIAGRRRMFRNLRFKLVYRPGMTGPDYTLYDLVNDPAEASDVTLRWPGIQESLRSSLDAIIASDPDVARTETDVSSTQRERLRPLGYVE